MTIPAILVLEDGSSFRGISIGIEGSTTGEVVFNTSLTGYQEILSDPSYARQIVTLTYPHIGNVGVNDADSESLKIFASGLVVRDVPLHLSNWRSQRSLREYLVAHKIVAIAEIDTRQLTRLLRDQGAQRGCIVAGQDLNPHQAKQKALDFPGLKGMDLAKEVSVDNSYNWNQGTWKITESLTEPVNRGKHVIAYDFGVKRNILRMFVERGCRITVVPAQTPAKDVLALAPDGVFLSNGPGDPEPCGYAINAIKTILQTKTPVFGICLGHQLLALAAGAKTIKMKFGHHGANHPVKEIESGTVLITSQNHGFAVDESSLPSNVKVTHRSLFDGTLQGIEFTDLPALGFQGHPEASPGPHDIGKLFDLFVEKMDQAAAQPSNS